MDSVTIGPTNLLELMQGLGASILNLNNNFEWAGPNNYKW